ncbi:MAG TPA: TolC family protein [Gemmataceae bacterium]|jgi:outer membrane protein TolC|nr:TolC family protein [Gemmataceae bacterium]
MPLLTFRRLACAGGIWLTAAGTVSAQTEVLPTPKTTPIPAPVVASKPTVTRYTLGDALAIARQKHPQLDAMRARVSAALIGQRGVGEAKRMVGFITPEIDVRVQQSDLGIRAAMAEYAQAQFEVEYAVIHCYYRVVFVREQTRVANDLVEHLQENLESVRKIVAGKGGVKGVTKNTEDTLEVAVAQAKTRQNQAIFGIERARAALREAMGLEPGMRVDAADEWLPEVNAELDRDTIIAHAITRRGEVTLALIGADVTRLEACAQWAKRFNMTADTFASGSDIHSRAIPAAERDPDYKPGAIGPDMPTKLVGNRQTRKDAAEAYATKAEAAAVQARSLVCLEAESAYVRWAEAARNVAVNRKGVEKSKSLVDRERDAAGVDKNYEKALQNEITASLQRKTLNDALYEQISALANLERCTAGGVKVNFPGR